MWGFIFQGLTSRVGGPEPRKGLAAHDVTSWRRLRLLSEPTLLWAPTLGCLERGVGATRVGWGGYQGPLHPPQASTLGTELQPQPNGIPKVTPGFCSSGQRGLQRGFRKWTLSPLST